MKAKQILLLLFIPLFAIQCKKQEEEPKALPCYATHPGFVCNINGEPFEIQGQYPCSSANIWYDRNTGNLSVSGADCWAEVGDPDYVGVYLFGVLKAGKYYPPSLSGRCRYRTNSDFNRYDSLLAGYVYIDELVLDNYNEDFSGGLVSGTFEFTLWNPSLNDTVHITDGSFCMPF